MSTAELIYLTQAVVMLLTLIVLVWQIRVFIKTARTAQYQTALQMLFDWRSDLIQNESLAERYESSRYFREVFLEHGVSQYFHTLKLFHILEVFFLLRDHGVINENMAEAWIKQTEIVMTPEKNRSLWHRLKRVNIYHKRFVDEVDAIVKRIETNEAHETA